MIYNKVILFGNFVEIITESMGHWENGKLINAGIKKTGTALVLPWNLSIDSKMMEQGQYSTKDLKLYAKEELHDTTLQDLEFTASIDNKKYIVAYLQKHNEADLFWYGARLLK